LVSRSEHTGTVAAAHGPVTQAWVAMINIAHLSDIHFGNRLSIPTWNEVANAVIAFDPDLIVVSGDLVDDPSPEHLLAAKCALADLSQRARVQSKARASGNGRAAELVVIPGNHDVFESGVAAGIPRLNWFERIFHGGDTSQAEMALKAKLNVNQLGFDDVCRGLPANTQPNLIQRAWARLCALVSGRMIAPWNKGDDWVTHLGAANPRPTVITAANSPLLLALLDSNPTHTGFYTATGLVDNDRLIGLNSALARAHKPYVARIGIVHHHVLPIAFAPGATRATGEPMMVLRNAGAVLRILADHKFDLILHGHWHKAQFTRIDFGTDDNDSYPMAVAAAGSAAMSSSENTSTNCFNLITIAENGRIAVKSVFYGAAQAPNPYGESGRHYRLYKEPLSATKRRCYIRARERHPIECDLRENTYEITENGDLWITHRCQGLRYHGQLPRYTKRPLGVFIPPHGHFVHETLMPDETSLRVGVTLSPAPEHPSSQTGQSEFYWINLPGGGLVRDGDPANYAIVYGLANCMTMTRWEALERAKPPPDREAGFDTEWVGMRVSFPMRKLVLKAKFPQSLAMAQPHVECRRDPHFPAYKIDDWGDAQVGPLNMVIDLEAQDEEQQELCYEAPTRTWTVEIDRPIVGCLYALRWEVPDDEPIQQIASNREWHPVLLKLGKRIDEATTDDADASKQSNLREAIRQIEDDTREWQRVLLNLGKRIDVNS
jgi:3',5'-cyclic AMP phosphodiesterase CpdA